MLVDVCIIGAGLSGAYAAKTLSDNSNLAITLVDSRHRVGGRLLTHSTGGDLGGAWIWPQSEQTIASLAKEMGIETVPMLLEGNVCARTHNGKRHVLNDYAGQYAACGSGAIRVKGGASTMVEKLVQNVPNLSIQLDTSVSRIEYSKEDGARVHCKNYSNNNSSSKTIHCRAVILAAPPKILINSIEFEPPLPDIKMESMYATPTWMHDYGKIAVSFEQNWWRSAQNSGVSIDQMGPVATWWEACSGLNGDGQCPTLAGFVTAQGATQLEKIKEAKALHQYIVETLLQLHNIDTETMGYDPNSKEAAAITGSIEKDGLVVSFGGVTVTYKSWKEDVFTNIQNPQKYKNADYESDYGDQDLKQTVGPLVFAGTETANKHGHMEGAIVAAQRAAKEVLFHLNSST